ncbi:2Fe-2S iron-sulfur cluster-binding protein [Marinobacterium aestuariivivens]|uniref:2Fe-2S iron-sulfur cluster-binding protein n=1 Tax=Marinobacterium aestuariivivens TaxID=1698799 RepID=A0ABW1ZWR5_9GAMM
MSTTRSSRPADPPRPAGFSIRVDNRQQSFAARPDRTLLAAMEASGARTIDVGCRGGGCGRCRIRVLDGRYDSKRMSRAHISEQDEAQGIVLACRIFARSDLVIESDHYRDPRQHAAEPDNNNEE